ncbi:MAG: hypothetical protein ACXAC7_03960 [Candidatus Hodarchaeales archaeon]
MKHYRLFLTILFCISLLFTQINSPLTQSYPSSDGNVNTPSKLQQDNIVEVTIEVTSPTGYTMKGNTPIILNLSSIASSLPASVDPFGLDTPNDPTDDIKWEAAYVLYDGSEIPSQVDDVDDQTGFSFSDELLFQLPEELDLESGQSATFNIYMGTNSANLPVPVYNEICNIYEYTKIDDILEKWPGMLGESYYMENGVIRAAILIEAAWSSGGFYELSLLESGWDIIKMAYPEDWEIWKWTRFALIEQFIELNDPATTNPFYTTRIITGPIRAQIQMQSIAPYGKPASSWGSKPGVYGLVTYDMYANMPYLDYTLEIVGPNAATNPELTIMFMNREYGGTQGGTHQNVYIPGLGYLERTPDDLTARWYQKSEFESSWFMEKIPPDGTFSCFGCDYPPGWTTADFLKAGYGMLFGDTGFSNMTWEKGSEWIRLWFQAMQFPFHARYLPFDKTITDDAESYMEENYQLWTELEPELVIISSIMSAADLPFEYIAVSKPIIKFDNVSFILDITNVSAVSSTLGSIIDTTTDVTHTYELLFYFNRTPTIVDGELTWNSVNQTWEALDIDISMLSFLTTPYAVRVKFESIGSTGNSPLSDAFPEGFDDIDPPIIKSITLNPAGIVRSGDFVNISCLVSDDIGRVEEVILSFNNGTWVNVTMEFSFGSYTGSIPPNATKEGTTIDYMIFAYDDSGNVNNTETFSFDIAPEYQKGQGLIPLLGGGIVVIAAIIVAVKTAGLHKQKYDEID